MKRTISIILLVFSMLFVSCGNTNKDIAEDKDMTTVTNDKSNNKGDKDQASLNAELEKEAIKADFISLNGKTEQNLGLKVFAEGKISVVDYNCVMDVFPSFMLSQEEGEGYGIYHISNTLNVADLKDGDYVKIYGVVDGTNDVGMIKILATVVEVEDI